MIFSTFDDMALDICSGELTRQVPTCASSQLFTLVAGSKNTCYVKPQPMCSDKILAGGGNNINCTSFPIVTAVKETGASYQNWSFQIASLG